MDKLPLIIMIILGTVAGAFVLMNYTSGAQQQSNTEKNVQETIDHEESVLSISGSCNDEDCLNRSIRECEIGETTVRESSNATMIVSVAGDGIYQGRPVCLISFYEQSQQREGNTTDGSIPLQTWSCKVPIAELRNHGENTAHDVRNKLVTTDYCVLQVP